MRLLLPTPHPDELLYSVVARHQAHLGSDLWDLPLQRVLSEGRPYKVDAPRGLAALERAAGEPFAAPVVARDMTLVPFYLAYQPEERVASVLGSMSGNVGVSPSKSLGVGMSRLARPTFLRFCPACRDVDLESLGETYWRRTHQLSGVVVCPDHGEELVDTDEPLLDRGSNRLSDATEATRRATGSPSRREGLDVGVALRVARRCRELLEGGYAAWTREVVSKGYAPAFAARGYDVGARQLDGDRVHGEFVGLYGGPLLSAMGVVVDGGADSSWLRSALRPKPKALTTLEHVLLQVFLESRPLADDSSVSAWQGPWLCPNPYFDHGGPTIHGVRLYVFADGTRRAIASCACGQGFSFKRSRPGSPEVPVVLRQLVVAPTWRREVLRRLAAGRRTVQEVAGEVGLSRHWVKRIAREGDDLEDRLAAEVAGRRERWEALLASVPDRSRHLARQIDPRLYHAILRTDRQWLLSEPRRGPRTTVGRVVDWERVDEEMLGAVRSSISAMRSDDAAPRITTASLAEASGLSHHRLYDGRSRARLPRTVAAIEEAEESWEAYHERKLRRVAREIVAEGLRPTPTRLRRRAGLERAHFFGAPYMTIIERVTSEVESDGHG